MDVRLDKYTHNKRYKFKKRTYTYSYREWSIWSLCKVNYSLKSCKTYIYKEYSMEYSIDYSLEYKKDIEGIDCGL